jgi:hypothetical protein
MFIHLTTNLTELNRIYGLYYEAVRTDDHVVAEKVWKDYIAYFRRYNAERGLDKHKA